MKNAVLCVSILLSIHNQAFAWSVGSWHGDDPVIPPPRIEVPAVPPVGEVIGAISNGVNNLGTQGAQALRGLVASVGNATGISDVIDHNAETFANMGRIHACIATICYSEVLRKNEIDKTIAEQRQQYDEAVAEGRRRQEKENAEERRQSLIRTYQYNAGQYNLLNSSLKIGETDLKLSIALSAAVGAEKNYRANLKAAGIDARPIASQEMKSVTDEFAKNLDRDLGGALLILNEQEAAVSQATGRSIGRLQAELVRILEPDALEKLQAKVDAHVLDLQAKNEKTRFEMLNAQAAASSANEQLTK